MYGVHYSSTLYEETVLKHCDYNRLTVTFFKVDSNNQVVYEAGTVDM